MSDTDSQDPPITLTKTEEVPPTPESAANTDAPMTKEVPIVDIPVHNPNVALNLIVALIGVAQKRGAFNIQESAKIWECIQMFNGPPQAPAPSPTADDAAAADAAAADDAAADVTE